MIKNSYSSSKYLLSQLIIIVIFQLGCSVRTVNKNGSIMNLSEKTKVEEPIDFSENEITIRVADYSPLYFRDSNGNWAGLDVELVKELVETAGYKAKFVDLPWSRAINYIENGNLHILMNLKRTEKRSKFMYWVGPMRQGEFNLIVKKENLSLPIKRLEDLKTFSVKKGLRIGYQNDVTYSPALLKMIENDKDEEYFYNVSQTVLLARMTRVNRILGYFESVYPTKYKIKNDPEYSELAIHPFVLRKTPVFYGLSKKNVTPFALKKIRASYEINIKNGKFQKIISKWNNK